MARNERPILPLSSVTRHQLDTYDLNLEIPLIFPVGGRGGEENGPK